VAAKRVDRGERLIHAPRARVFRALTDGTAVAAWLAPADMTARIQAFDPRPGGAFWLTLTFKDAAHATPGKASADSDKVEGTFAEIVPDERIVWAVTFPSDDPSYGGVMRMTWTFEDAAGGTLVTIRAEDVPPGISAADHQTGLDSSLANLAAWCERG